MITTKYTWRCEKCGESDKGKDKKWLEVQHKSHKCNPVLYDIVRKMPTKFKLNDLIINNNGAVGELREYLGISEGLASSILDEMEEMELAETAAPSSHLT